MVVTSACGDNQDRAYLEKIDLQNQLKPENKRHDFFDIDDLNHPCDAQLVYVTKYHIALVLHESCVDRLTQCQRAHLWL
jgi:hypothetical protein